ncbi:hypothetical protein RRF57_007143 [Xylaria bambusicola]|uniref:Uncharacterized protein n=1 Tax=Xylaria bambusicola TaxID=326684 RepID=A0AAN7V073_9PEZI
MPPPGWLIMVISIANSIIKHNEKTAKVYGMSYAASAHRKAMTSRFPFNVMTHEILYAKGSCDRRVGPYLPRIPDVGENKLPVWRRVSRLASFLAGTVVVFLLPILDYRSG